MDYYGKARTALAALAIAGLGSTAVAQTPAPGRYQMMPLPGSSSAYGSSIVILDTQEGHFWKWIETPTTPTSKGFTALWYQGKVAPGAKPGERVLFRE